MYDFFKYVKTNPQFLKALNKPLWDYRVSDIFIQVCQNCGTRNDSKLGSKTAFMCHDCKHLLYRPKNVDMLNPYINIDGLIVPLKPINNTNRLKAFIHIS